MDPLNSGFCRPFYGGVALGVGMGVGVPDIILFPLSERFLFVLAKLAVPKGTSPLYHIMAQWGTTSLRGAVTSVCLPVRWRAVRPYFPCILP